MACVWRGRVFTLASALSLLLCAAACALWVRSYFADDCVGYARNAADGLHRRVLAVEASDGQVWLTWWSRDYTATANARDAATRRGLPKAGWFYLRSGPLSGAAADNSLLESMGFHFWLREPVTALDTSSEVGAPFWAVALACLAAPVLWFRQARRGHARRRAGLCARCGYDLRASPQRCPECGAAVGA
jgi:hypothetical protein